MQPARSVWHEPIVKAVLALATLGVPQGILAQNYPVKPVRIVSGFAPGGGVDIMARLLAPAATPREIVNKLADAIIKAARSADTTQRLHDLGAEPVGYTPEEAARFLRDEVVLWAAVVKASGARAD